MKILSFEYDGDGLTIEKIAFRRRVNLLVGRSGAGKSSLVQLLFKAALLANGKRPFKLSSRWSLEFEVEQSQYKWSVELRRSENSAETSIINETLELVSGSSTKILFSRTQDESFFAGTSVPKLSLQQSGIWLYKEEKTIAAVFQAFGRFQIRAFDSALLETMRLQHGLPKSVFNNLTITKSSATTEEKLSQILVAPSLNLKLFFIEHFELKDTATQIIRSFKDVFPEISDLRIAEGNNSQIEPFIESYLPVVVFKENNGHRYDLSRISSGMAKTLLLIIDLIVMKELGNCVYILDEYENSMGIRALKILPELLSDIENTTQFFITTHHPYIINQIDIENWLYLKRNGKSITHVQGKDLKEHFQHSSQENFIQLINDEELLGAVE